MKVFIMKNVFVVAATIVTLSLSAVSFAEQKDDARSKVVSLKSDIHSLERKLSAQGIDFNKNVEVSASGYFLQERALQARHAELKGLLSASRAN